MRPNPMIELHQISKTFTVNNHSFSALDKITLSISQGEIFGIFGESGAGKSTLLRCINLLERPSTGTVSIQGIDFTTLTAQALRKKRQRIGMIFQHFNLLQSRTVAENIALPLELSGQSQRQVLQKVDDLLKVIKLESHKHHYPDELSGGQKQRVAIARALATGPEILLCDEATSALDPKSTTAILKLLKKINHDLNVTIVLITHEMDVIKKICDRGAVLDHGKLIECGPTLQLFARPKSPVTKQLVQQALQIHLPKFDKPVSLLSNSEKICYVLLTFLGNDCNDSFITSLIRKFNLNINILQANIEHIQKTSVGWMVCQLQGEEAIIDDALAFIRHSSVSVEVITHG